MPRKSGLTIAKVRRGLYRTNQLLGDIQAIRRGRFIPHVERRVTYHLVNKFIARVMNKLF